MYLLKPRYNKLLKVIKDSQLESMLGLGTNTMPRGDCVALLFRVQEQYL